MADRRRGVLSLTRRAPAEVLVVEGWIGRAGIEAAMKELDEGGDRCVIASGGFTGEGWMERCWSHAEMGERELLRLGVPRGNRVVRGYQNHQPSTINDQPIGLVWFCSLPSCPVNMNRFFHHEGHEDHEEAAEIALCDLRTAIGDSPGFLARFPHFYSPALRLRGQFSPRLMGRTAVQEAESAARHMTQWSL